MRFDAQHNRGLLLSRIFILVRVRCGLCWPACMSCVMTKKTFTDFLFLEVLSHNVGDWNHVLFMPLSLVWNIGHLRLCSAVYIIKRVNFHGKRTDSTPHVVISFRGESWNSLGFLSSHEGKNFFPILGFLSCTTSSCECVYPLTLFIQ